MNNIHALQSTKNNLLVNVTKVEVEKLVSRLIEVRFPKFKSEINQSKVVKSVLNNPNTPILQAESNMEVNQLTLLFRNQFNFQVRRIIIDLLIEITTKIQHRVTNNIVIVTPEQRKKIMSKRNSFREVSNTIPRITSNSSRVVSLKNFGGIAS